MNQLNDFDSQELKFIDVILDNELNNNESCNEFYYRDKFGIPLDSFKRLKNTVCDVLESENLAKIYPSITNYHTILKFKDENKTIKFIDKGSISGYLKREDDKFKLENKIPRNWGKISVIVTIVLAIVFFFLDMFKPELRHNIIYQLSDKEPTKTELKSLLINEDSLSECSDSLSINTDSLNILPLDTIN